MRRVRKLLLVLLVMAVLGGAGFLFHTRKMIVEGSSYYGQPTIASWIGHDQLSANTLYVLARYRFTHPPLPTGIERLDVSLVNPWTLRVRVTDKKRLGYMDHNGGYVYFGEGGIALFHTKKVLENTPYVTGITFSEGASDEDVKMGEPLPAQSRTVFDRLAQVEELLERESVPFSAIDVTDDQISVTTEGVLIRLGEGLFDEKIARIPAVLEKLYEVKEGAKGELHMEQFTREHQTISFVPSE